MLHVACPAQSYSYTELGRQYAWQTASLTFREQGLENASVPDIMSQVGLTAGGFYAHFPTKTALIAEACAATLAASAERTLEQGKSAPEGQGLQAILNHYFNFSVSAWRLA